MGEVQKHLYVLILAGGGGTRLWPMSRDASPKQFAKLFGGKSLFELTLARAHKLTTKSQIFIVTSGKYLSKTRKEASSIPPENIIGEPMRRDTALAMALGATYILAKDPEAIILNLPCDHLISPDSKYISEIKTAVQAVYEQQLFTVVGVRPRFPHTGYGHIKAIKPIGHLLQGIKFIEKPALPLAEKFTKTKGYFWNVGQYIWPAKLYLELLKKHSPKTYANLPRVTKSIGTEGENEAIQLAFQMAPTISVDYAVSEKLTQFRLFPATFHWTDVGDWKEVWNNLEKDSQGNVITAPKGRGNYVGIDSKNNLMFLDKQLITTVGMSNMVIVDTPDALLICPKDDSQSVKKIVEMLKIQKLDQYI